MSNEINPDLTDESIDKEIELFRKNMLILRKLSGWTAEQLGNKVNKSKQSIINIERNNASLTKNNYLLLRRAFDIEADERAEKGDMVLRQAMNILLNPEETKDEDDDCQEKFNIIADAQKRGDDPRRIKIMMNSFFKNKGAIAAAATALGAAFYLSFFGKGKR